MHVRVTGGSRSGGATLSRLSLVIQGCPGHSGAIKVASALCASTTSNTRGFECTDFIRATNSLWMD